MKTMLRTLALLLCCCLSFGALAEATPSDLITPAPTAADESTPAPETEAPTEAPTEQPSEQPDATHTPDAEPAVPTDAPSTAAPETDAPTDAPVSYTHLTLPTNREV